MESRSRKWTVFFAIEPRTPPNRSMQQGRGNLLDTHRLLSVSPLWVGQGVLKRVSYEARREFCA
jgi:hypothetical protein